MYGEEFIRNEYNTGRHRWFMKRHPPLCGDLPAWRQWQLYQQNVVISKGISRAMLDALRMGEPAEAKPEPVVVQ